MKYLISNFPCQIVGKESFRLVENLKYELQDIDDSFYTVFGENQELPICINFKDLCTNKSHANILCFDYGCDDYTILFSRAILPNSVNILKLQNSELVISLSGELTISIDSECILQTNVEKLNFSHYEMWEDFCIIFFEGKRNYLVIIKDKQICCADYYDEVNKEEKEIYFMKRLYDSLNHGKVYMLKDKTFDSYLIYLDDEDMNLNSEFTMVVFLDALMAGNFEYCNRLLSEDIRQEDASKIVDFFPKFDDYIPLANNSVAMIEKNTLAGIFKFDIVDSKIENIIEN